MIVPDSQASMSIPNMVGGVILLVALFVVILICLFNLRYYIWEGNPAAERRSWQGWFSLRDREDDTKGEKAIKAIELDWEKGQFIRNPPLTGLHPRSTIRRTLWTTTPPQPGVPLSLPLPPPVPIQPSTPSIYPNVTLPPAVIIKPRSRKNSRVFDTSQSIKLPPHKSSSPPTSRKSTHSSSFEAATGIGMGPAYRPPPPPLLSLPTHVQPNAKAADVRNSIMMEFQHYFNPFSWVATGAQEGKDLDGQNEESSGYSSTPRQRGEKAADSQLGEVATAL